MIEETLLRIAAALEEQNIISDRILVHWAKASGSTTAPVETPVDPVEEPKKEEKKETPGGAPSPEPATKRVTKKDKVKAELTRLGIEFPATYTETQLKDLLAGQAKKEEPEAKPTETIDMKPIAREALRKFAAVKGDIAARKALAKYDNATKLSDLDNKKLALLVTDLKIEV